MPRTRSLAWSELKIGITSVVAILIAATTIFLLMGGRGFFWQRYTLKTKFASAAGLKPGSPVRIAGVEKGTVTAVELVGDAVDVSFDVNRDVRSRITDKSTAYMGSVSLLGESAVDITAATTGAPIEEGGYVPAGRAPGSLSSMAPELSEGVTELTNLLRDVRAGKGTVGKLMTDQALYDQLNQFVAAAGEVTRGIQQGRGTIGKLLNDPKAATALEASLTNLEEMTRSINAGEGSLGQLLKNDAFARSLTDTTANLKGLTDRLNTLTDRLNKGEGTAGKLLTDASLFNRLNDLTDRFDQMATSLNQGEGTAGQLLKDKQLYENMNGAVGEFRALLTEIKRDPRKYLNVRVSIF